MKKLFKWFLILLSILLGIFLAYSYFNNKPIQNYIKKSRVFITGNIHGQIDIDKLSEEYFPTQNDLSKNDYVIIIGDFGLVWDGSIEDEMKLDELNKKNYTLLFIDGSHENFDLLEKYPIKEWNGGSVRVIRNHIYQLMRGQIYTINNKKYFIFGGGESTDKEYRQIGKTYWKQEYPSIAEWSFAMGNLKKNNNAVDYILTQSAPSEDLRIIGAHLGKNLGSGNTLNANLQTISDNIKYKRWFHGYYHLDMEISKKHRSIFNDILELK